MYNKIFDTSSEPNNSSNMANNNNKEHSNSSKSKLRESKEISCSEFKSLKENDPKHSNAIKPYLTKERKNSKKDIRGNGSPYEMSRSKSKRLESSSNKKLEQSMNSRQLNEIYQELVNLKNEYKALKGSYNLLAKEKHDIASRQEHTKQESEKEIKRLGEEVERHKKTSEALQIEIERIKKECFKILESEKFKNKKLEETLQEKELMISFLRNENECIKKNYISLNNANGNGCNVNNNNNNGETTNPNQQNPLNPQQLQMMMNGSQIIDDKIFFLQNSAPIFSYESYARLSANNSTMSICSGNGGVNNGSVMLNSRENPQQQQSNVLIDAGNNFPVGRHQNQCCHQRNPASNEKPSRYRKAGEFEEDSLSFSRDKEREFDSVHSLLSNNNNVVDENGTSMMNEMNDEDHDLTVMPFTKKDVIMLEGGEGEVEDGVQGGNERKKDGKGENNINSNPKAKPFTDSTKMFMNPNIHESKKQKKPQAYGKEREQPLRERKISESEGGCSEESSIENCFEQQQLTTIEIDDEDDDEGLAFVDVGGHASHGNARANVIKSSTKSRTKSKYSSSSRNNPIHNQQLHPLLQQLQPSSSKNNNASQSSHSKRSNPNTSKRQQHKRLQIITTNEEDLLIKKHQENYLLPSCTEEEEQHHISLSNGTSGGINPFSSGDEQGNMMANIVGNGNKSQVHQKGHQPLSNNDLKKKHSSHNNVNKTKKKISTNSTANSNTNNGANMANNASLTSAISSAIGLKKKR